MTKSIFLKLKKRYFLIFNTNLFDEFKNDKHLSNYMLFLLSDYYFPNIEDIELETMVMQLIKMYDNNNIDLNLILKIVKN